MLIRVSNIPRINKCSARMVNDVFMAVLDFFTLRKFFQMAFCKKNSGKCSFWMKLTNKSSTMSANEKLMINQ